MSKVLTARAPSCTSLRRNKITRARKRRRHVYNFHNDNITRDNSSGDLDSCEVRTSNIPGAGLGLFATKHIKAGKRVTKYSGTKIGKAAALSSNSSYIVEIHSRLYLDADGPGHMVGRYMNDGPLAGIPVNARLGASRRVYQCKKTGRFWIPVIATKDIKPGEEIVIKYGKKVTWTWPAKAGPSNPRHADDKRNDDDDRADKKCDGKSKESSPPNDSSSEHRQGPTPSNPHQHPPAPNSENHDAAASGCDDTKIGNIKKIRRHRRTTRPRTLWKRQNPGSTLYETLSKRLLSVTYHCAVNIPRPKEVYPTGPRLCLQKGPA